MLRGPLLRSAALAAVVVPARSARSGSDGDDSELIARFRRDGFVIIRGGVARGAAAALRAEMSARLASDRASARVWLRRCLSNVQAAERRHSVEAALSPAARAALATLLRERRALYAALLPGAVDAAELVELGAIASLPGARAQAAHPDIAACEPCELVTTFVALQDVSREMGPTMVYARTQSADSHARVHARVADARRVDAAQYAEFVDDGVAYYDHRTAEDDEAARRDAALRAHCGGEGPTACVLRAGDVLVMDTKVWHYGGENTSRRERFLLQFSFLGAQCAGGGAPPRPRGFTYHLDGSLRGMRLGDFGA